MFLDYCCIIYTLFTLKFLNTCSNCLALIGHYRVNFIKKILSQTP